MSDMHFREDNEVKWQGVRPGHNGTQVLLSAQVAAVVPTSFYTVPVGQTLFITNIFMGRGSNPISGVFLAIYTAVPALHQYLALNNWQAVPYRAQISKAYWPPIEVAAGYHLYYSQSANCGLTYVVHGWGE